VLPAQQLLQQCRTCSMSVMHHLLLLLLLARILLSPHA
jgi:hypothetical protein